MKVNIITKDNTICSVYAKDEHITEIGQMVERLVDAKLTGGKINSDKINLDASDVKGIHIEFE